MIIHLAQTSSLLIVLLNISVRDNKHNNCCCLQRPLCEGLQRLLQNDNTCLQSFSEFYFTNITHVSSNNFIETCAEKKCYWRCQDVSVQSCQVVSTRYWALVSAQSHIKATTMKNILNLYIKKISNIIFEINSKRFLSILWSSVLRTASS